jgi:hypothetical protein
LESLAKFIIEREMWYKWEQNRETVPKIHIVILSEAKNLIFFFSSQKSKKRSFGLLPQDDTER